MTRIFNMLAAMVFLALLASPANADGVKVPERILGKADAPITVEEFVSLTCSHCADFYNTILPDLEKKYVETGKVKFILRDFPLDAVGLKAASLARCMPEDEYYPFVKILYKNQAAWATGTPEGEKTLTQYAKLGGLPADKAQACLQDAAMQDAIIAGRTDAGTKYNVEATPTFVINGGAETIRGTRTAQEFSSAFDRLLAAKK